MGAPPRHGTGTESEITKKAAKSFVCCVAGATDNQLIYFIKTILCVAL